MKKSISQDESEILDAIMESDPAPELNREEFLQEAYEKYAQGIKYKKKRPHRRRNILRGGIIAASITIFLFITSTFMAVLMPPPDAKAETWFEKVIVSIRNALRIETEPGIVDDIDEPYVTYLSIEEARAAGYQRYAPTYIPEGFTLSEISILQSAQSMRANYRLEKDEFRISIQYSWSANSQHDTLTTPEHTDPFAWGDFIGYTTEYENGISILTCVSHSGFEMISALGDIPSNELILIVEGMKKAASGD